MNYFTNIQSITAALAHGSGSPTIAREDLAKIEDAMETLGDYPGMIGESLLAFRRAMGLLKSAHGSDNGDAIVMISAHIRELWAALAPALEKLAAASRQRGK